MKMMLKKLNAVKLRAFTLIEMLVVLLIISILLLLFVPNLSKQRILLKRLEMRLWSRSWILKQNFMK